jgi:hypothetical protein
MDVDYSKLSYVCFFTFQLSFILFNALFSSYCLRALLAFHLSG